MAETIEGLKQWLDINYPKKLPFETVDTTGIPTDSPMFPALIRYSTVDEQVYSWSIDNGIGRWKVGMSGTSPFIVGEVKTVAIPTTPIGWLKCDGSAISRTTYSDLFDAIGTIYGTGDGSNTFNVPNFNGRTPVGAGQLVFNTSFNYTDVNISTDVITISTNDTFYTGTPVTISTSGTMPAGLVAGTTYYIIKLTSTPTTTIKLATTSAFAVAGTAINVTSQGTGIHTITYTGTNRVLGSVGGEESHAQTTNEMPSHNHKQQLTRGGVQGIWTGSDTACDEPIINAWTDNTGGSQSHNNMQPYSVVNYLIKY